MSSFNTEQFFQTSTKDAHDTELIPVPEGVYDAVVTKLELKKFDGKDGKPDSHLLEITWSILDHDGSVAKKTGLPENKVRQACFLDIENGSLTHGAGKNIRLGQLREAVGQNKPGKAWSPSHLNGAQAKVLVGHRPDRDDPKIIYGEVKKVSKAAYPPGGGLTKGLPYHL